MKTGYRPSLTIDFNTEVFDVGTNFASDTFTAPVAGKYFFTTGVTVLNQDRSNACPEKIELSRVRGLFRRLERKAAHGSQEKYR